MNNHALKHWLLVDYAGYPFAPNSLMPDNGLANLASALIQCQAEVEILDYCTVDTVRRMTTPELGERLSKAWHTLRQSNGGVLASARKLATLLTLQQCEKDRRSLQDKAVAAISREIVAHIQSRGIEAVGFKLWNGDGLEGSCRIAQYVRTQCPGVRLFAGGPHVDLFMERILVRYPFFDALVSGEAEETIQLLAASGGNPASYGTIPNLIYSKDGSLCRTEERIITNLDDLPIPTYDPAVYPAMAGDSKIKIIVIDESRGCKNDCAFCVHPVKSHHQVRTKGIARLIREIKALDDQYGYRVFRFAGSCTPYSLLNQFAAEVVAQGIPVRYASFAHVRDSEEADFKAIRRSGGLSLFFGIESGSQRLLDVMRKRIRAERTIAAIRDSKAAGIFTVGSIIFPAPGEDNASEAATLSLLRAAKPDSLMLQAPIVAPRTDWFDNPEEYGIHFKSKEDYMDVAMTWKVRIQLPPRFWSPLPISIDGRPYRKILAKTGSLARRLAAMDVPTSISDETYLMSAKAGVDPVMFRDSTLAAFYSGDSDAIQDWVRRINAG